MARNQIRDDSLEREYAQHHGAENPNNSAPPQIHSDFCVCGVPAPGKVLVVDDDPLVLSMAARTLRRYGFEVVTASDGRAAIEIYQEERGAIDLVVLDMTMPAMDGIDTCSALYALDPNLRVIIVSGYDVGATDSDALPDCVKGFVQKPYRPSDLSALINDVLDTEKR